ncbi:MAG: shikimate kinase [Desulfobacterium sp.]
MKHKRNIILTGFMGTGKTTVGKRVAQSLEYEFVDTDVQIMSQNHCTIAEIFENQGEAAFRQMESDLARDLAHRQGLVISTGGKMMLDKTNKDVLEKSGMVFCLVADPVEIMARVSGDSGVERPLLKGANGMETLIHLLSERKKGYGQYLQVDTMSKSPDEVAQTLMAMFHKLL